MTVRLGGAAKTKKTGESLDVIRPIGEAGSTSIHTRVLGYRTEKNAGVEGERVAALPQALALLLLNLARSEWRKYSAKAAPPSLCLWTS